MDGLYIDRYISPRGVGVRRVDVIVHSRYNDKKQTPFNHTKAGIRSCNPNKEGKKKKRNEE